MRFNSNAGSLCQALAEWHCAAQAPQHAGDLQQLVSNSTMFSPYLTAQHALAVQPLKALCNVWQAISVESHGFGCSCALTASILAIMQLHTGTNCYMRVG